MRSVDVRAGSDNAAGAQHRSDPGLHVIAEKGSQKLLARVAQSRRRPELRGAIGVLDVAVGRERAEVDPSAEVGMTDEALVSLVAVAEHNAVVDLAADLAHRANRRGRDAVAHDVGTSADEHGTAQSSERIYLRTALDENRTGGRVKNHVRPDFNARLNEHAGFTDDGLL